MLICAMPIILLFSFLYGWVLAAGDPTGGEWKAVNSHPSLALLSGTSPDALASGRSHVGRSDRCSRYQLMGYAPEAPYKAGLLF